MKIVNFYIKKIFPRTPITRMIFFVISDTLLIGLSIVLAFLLRFDGNIPVQYFPVIQRFIFLALIFSLPIFYFSRLYSFSWSYISAGELISLIRASVISFLFLSLSLYLSKDFPFFSGFPRSTIFISYFLVILFCGGIRFSKRIFLQVFNNRENENKRRTLIVGAGDAGEQLLRSVLGFKNSIYFPVGFVDDNFGRIGETIHGVRILGKINDIPQLIKNNLIESIVIALPSIGSKTIKKAVELGRNSGIKEIKVIPPVSEIINGKISITNLREVEIEDLLGREAVYLDQGKIKDFVFDKKILITGAAGSIGSELCRQIAKFDPSLLLIIDQDETGIFNISKELRRSFPALKLFSIIANIQDKEKNERIFKEFHPDIVFHAAAYKHVPLMEDFPDEAIKNNVFGTNIITQISLKHGVKKFIFISTDKAINPTSVMGATKRVGEMICQTLNNLGSTKFISVRFGNVLNSRGSVIPTFREQIKKGGPIEITHPDMKRYFMTTSEACLLVMQAGAMGQGGEVFVLDMGEPVRILDLAKEMIKLSGFEPDKDIPIVFTGIRPGEKLFEEMLSAEEGTLATQNQKIFMAKLLITDEKKIKDGLEKLKQALKQYNQEELVGILCKLVPFYKK